MKDNKYLTENLIAHRGVHYEYMENSIKAFREAMLRKYIIELDVHLTKDKEVVVYHDFNLKRLTGINKDIENITYKEIKRIINIPTIEDVLKLVKGRTPIIIETKVIKVGELERILNNILSNYNGRIAIQSFNYKSLLWFKKNSPKYPRGYLINSLIPHNIFIKYLLNNKLLNKIIKPTYIGINLDYLKNKEIIKLRSKYLIIGYTISNELEYNKYINYTDNLICNIKKVPYYKEFRQKQRD